ASKNTGHVAFSPEGNTVAVSTFDNAIQLWELPQIRRQLTAFGLDWQERGRPRPLWISQQGLGPTEGEDSRVGNRKAGETPPLLTNRPSGLFYAFALVGVLVAILAAVYTLRYQQRVMRSYEEIDSVASQRAAELKLAHVELLHSQKMKALGTL